MDIAEDLIETTESNDYDCFFVRGYVYEMIGEDGKAIADWRKGLEMLSNNVNLDAYVCLMSKAICDMILYKERLLRVAGIDCPATVGTGHQYEIHGR